MLQTPGLGTADYTGGEDFLPVYFYVILIEPLRIAANLEGELGDCRVFGKYQPNLSTKAK
ncbi:MAG: hypothetical protein ICV79_12680 [Flavisolibacter sp.]|nr:hypothetical protein [Flavisolibacter sp.]